MAFNYHITGCHKHFTRFQLAAKLREAVPTAGAVQLLLDRD
jgi:hypothetical protein